MNKKTEKLNQEFHNLLSIENLDNIKTFTADFDTFEEIPLYSYYNQLWFIKDLNLVQKHSFLLEKCLQHIDDIYDTVKHTLEEKDVNNYFICLTLTSWDEVIDEEICQFNFFVTRKFSWLNQYIKFVAIDMNSDKAKFLSPILEGLELTSKYRLYSNGEDKIQSKSLDRLYIISDYFISKT